MKAATTGFIKFVNTLWAVANRLTQRGGKRIHVVFSSIEQADIFDDLPKLAQLGMRR